MASGQQPTKTETVVTVLRNAAAPMTLDELLAAVSSVVSFQSRDPRQALRNTLMNTSLIQKIADGRYVYLPRLLSGATLRQPLTAEDLKRRTLTTTDEIRVALWIEPSRKDMRPRTFTLPDGTQFSVPPEHFAHYAEQSLKDTPLWEWLKREQARDGDDLLVRVVSGEEALCRLELERGPERMESRITARNEALADAAYEICRGSRSQIFVHDLALRLLAYGVYHDPCPPEPLMGLLAQDERFLLGWHSVEIATPADRKYVALLREGKISGEAAGSRFIHPFIRSEEPLPPPRRVTKQRRQELARLVYAFKAALAYRKGTWRLIEVCGDQTLGDLDDAMREAFNHDPSDHLSEFYLGGGRNWNQRGFGTIDPFGEGEGSDVVIGELGLEAGDELRYIYDFGDDIQHTLTVEAIHEAEAGVKYPRVVAQNKPRHRYCERCRARGKKAVATWVCVDCSNRHQRDVLVCEDCLTEEHEDHYAEEWVY